MADELQKEGLVENNNRTLVTGFIGQRPAAVYSPLAPFVEYLGNADVRFAVTSGTDGTQSHEDKLRAMTPLDRLNWLDPIVFDKQNGELAVEQILEHARGYDRVFFAIKGGVGSWSEKLLLLVVRDQSFPEFSLILSDGSNGLLIDKTGKEIMRHELASLGLQGYLVLNGLVVSSGEVNDNRAINGLLRHNHPYNGSELPFFILCEHRGFLYTACRAETWLDAPDKIKYQNEFRRHIGQCRNLTVESGRILLVAIDNKKQTKTLEQRCKEQGIKIIVIQGYNKAGCQQVEDTLSQMIRSLHPGDAYKVGPSEPAEITRNQIRISQPSTLVIAASSLDSPAHLLAAQTHHPQTLLVFYDHHTKGTKEAAHRLKEIIQSQNPPAAGQVLLNKTDHIGGGIIADIKKRRGESPEPWDFNLTPGTKEQSFMFILSSRPGDRFWFFDTKGESVQRIDTEDKLPQRYPPLADIAWQLGGKLKSRGHSLGSGDLPADTFSQVQEVFQALSESQFKGALSANNGQPKTKQDLRPVYCENNMLTVESTRRVLNLKKLFPWFTSRNHDGKIDNNLWLEPMVAASFLAAGADEVVCNLQWTWDSQHLKEYFRDEQDVVALFGSKIYVISCKTALPKEKKDRPFWEVEYNASHFFGRFAVPVIAVPFSVQTGSELRHGQLTKDKAVTTSIIGCRTQLVGANFLADPNALKSWLCRLR
ncbi:MAG: hypothetical protein J0665_18220 [Deltaproteobacteria bacterium]|nr:hypothetical protein [Deltaproteobacteria bacterium]